MSLAQCEFSVNFKKKEKNNEKIEKLEKNQHFLSYFLEKTIAKNKLYCYYKRVK